MVHKNKYVSELLKKSNERDQALRLRLFGDESADRSDTPPKTKGSIEPVTPPRIRPANFEKSRNSDGKNVLSDVGD